MDIFWLTLAVFLWGIVHSILASLEAKGWFHRTFGNASVRFYRLAYNMFSVVSFAPILWLMVILPDKVLYRVPVPWMYLFLAGQLTAIVLLIVGVLQTDTLAFIGLRQVIEGERRSPKLVTGGLYRWVRHPLYAAGLLFIWLAPLMSQNSLIVTIAATVYIIVGALFEERKLRREFGQEYEEYRAKTPMLVPGLKFGRNK